MFGFFKKKYDFNYLNKRINKEIKNFVKNKEASFIVITNYFYTLIPIIEIVNNKTKSSFVIFKLTESDEKLEKLIKKINQSEVIVKNEDFLDNDKLEKIEKLLFLKQKPINVIFIWFNFFRNSDKEFYNLNIKLKRLSKVLSLNSTDFLLFLSIDYAFLILLLFLLVK
ncbi:MAG: hypothetical protein ABGW69_00440 [Nanoarchaeota archaeon]